jgi:hypothetical protein
MNTSETLNILNNYPYSASPTLNNLKYLEDWYPFSYKKYGYTQCPYCERYWGEQCKNINTKTIYKCKKCEIIFMICSKCFSHCIVKNNNDKYNMISYTSLYTLSTYRLSNILPLNVNLIKIIHKYSIFDRFFIFNDEISYNCHCPRCDV